MMSDTDLNQEVNGSSKLYMVIWFLITLLVIGSMTIQFIGVKGVIENSEIKNEVINQSLIKQISDSIPYEPLIYTLIVYMMGLFGIEGTRSVIKSMDISKAVKNQAQNMPKFKRRRLIFMFSTFFILALIAMFFQLTTSAASANFHLDTIFYGILFGGSLIAYSDFCPKLSNDIAHNLALKKELEKEEEEKK